MYVHSKMGDYASYLRLTLDRTLYQYKLLYPSRIPHYSGELMQRKYYLGITEAGSASMKWDVRGYMKIHLRCNKIILHQFTCHDIPVSDDSKLRTCTCDVILSKLNLPLLAFLSYYLLYQ